MIATGVSMMLISLVILAEKGIIVDKRFVSKIWKISPLKCSIEASIESVIMKDSAKQYGESSILKLAMQKL